LNEWINVVFLGDSLTAGFQQGPGYMPPRYYRFTNLLESSLRLILQEKGIGKDLAISNLGVDGDSTSGMLERFNRSVIHESPEVVLIWGGINDLSTRITPEEVFQNIIKLIAKTKDIEAIPIVISISPVVGTHFNELVQKLNSMIKDYCIDTKVEYIDVYSELIDSEGKLADEYSNDGIHLSDLGYRKVMIQVYQTILKILIENSYFTEHL
jgi:acyl-CoA thioesterase I